MREKQRRTRSSASDADEPAAETQSATRTADHSERDPRPLAEQSPAAHPAPAQPDTAVPEAATVPDGVAVPSPGDRARRKRERNIQRSLAGTDTSRDDVPEQVLAVIGSGGMPLDLSLRRPLEERMDADFSTVRIHTGGKAAEAAEAIDARAFTCGTDIVFNAGEYDPESPEGQHLLAHELAHVTQQRSGGLTKSFNK
ncbi:DUF4157 domain-containing protein [Natrinema pallidum]|uniref:DUF4157 domain-containing protein n=1 Tax=Natrinema pallidum TaxID=69527 RepID=A0A4P9TDK4_9EURY|nr:DUF4157 domain-containing protein [Natrinema pallidum]QCW01740.1 DUF4157 domain-containing protein [Natrinema pallidum]